MLPAPEQTPSAGTSAGTRECLVCHRSFIPKKSNQLYERPACKRRALRIRKQAESISQDSPGRRIRPVRLWATLMAERLRDGLPSLRRDVYLEALASYIEAIEQEKRWARLKSERNAALRRLAEPDFDVHQYLLNEPARLPAVPEAVQSGATHGAIISTDGALGLLLLCRDDKKAQ